MLMQPLELAIKCSLCQVQQTVFTSVTNHKLYDEISSPIFRFLYSFPYFSYCYYHFNNSYALFRITTFSLSLFILYCNIFLHHPKIYTQNFEPFLFLSLSCCYYVPGEVSQNNSKILQMKYFCQQEILTYYQLFLLLPV